MSAPDPLLRKTLRADVALVRLLASMHTKVTYPRGLKRKVFLANGAMEALLIVLGLFTWKHDLASLSTDSECEVFDALPVNDTTVGCATRIRTSV